jgi:hypothetical protein
VYSITLEMRSAKDTGEESEAMQAEGEKGRREEGRECEGGQIARSILWLSAVTKMMVIRPGGGLVLEGLAGLR